MDERPPGLDREGMADRAQLLSWKKQLRTTLLTTFPGIDSCLMVTKRDFLEMEASL